MKGDNMRKIILAVLAVALAVGGIFLGRYLFSVQAYKQEVAQITYANRDAEGVPDGTYQGECDVKFIRARVEVSVVSGKIQTIRLLEHFTDQGAAAEGIEQVIVQQQRVDVDAVSGATNSSGVIKKAVDNALSAGRQNT